MSDDRRLIALPPLLRPGRIDDVQLIVAGHDPHKAYRLRHGFAFHSMGVVLHGHGTYQVDDGPVQQITPGSCFGVYPGPVFSYGPAPGTTWNEYYVGVAGPGVNRWVRWGLLDRSNEVHGIGNPGDIVMGFERLMDAAMNEHDGDRAIIEAGRVLLEVRDRSGRGNRSAPLDGIVERVSAHCEAHLAEPIDFESLAADLGVSYSALRKRVRDATGQPPQKFLTAMRCERARELLSDHRIAVQAVGAQVGIADPYAFSKTFKRTVGLSPRAYRAQVRYA